MRLPLVLAALLVPLLLWLRSRPRVVDEAGPGDDLDWIAEFHRPYPSPQGGVP